MNTLLDVVMADHAKNHEGREYTAQDAARLLALRMQSGKPMYTHGPVIIVFDPIDQSSVEFHCINGGTAQDLAVAAQAFFSDMAASFECAVTYFDNPAISHVAAKYVPTTAKITKINDGPDRTYKAVFHLRSA